MTSSQPTSDRIMRLITGYWATGIVGAASSHSVFTHLENGATNAEQLADRAAISQRGAQALLDGLVSLGLVEQHGGGYRNSAEASAFLVEGSPDCLTGFAKLKAGHMASLTDLPEVVRVGGPISDAVVEVADNPHWEELVQALAAQSVPVARTAADTLKIADSRRDLDPRHRRRLRHLLGHLAGAQPRRPRHPARLGADQRDRPCGCSPSGAWATASPTSTATSTARNSVPPGRTTSSSTPTSRTRRGRTTTWRSSPGCGAS